MLPSERKQKIYNYIQEKGTVLTGELCKRMGVSVATILRDINSLDAEGKIEKIHGGARKLDQKSAELCLSYAKAERIDPFYKIKDKNAQIAARLIKPHDVLFLGGGMTCTLMARYIKGMENITVVTTNINAVLELAGCCSVVLIGGDIYVGSMHMETLSEFSMGLLPNLYFNKAFFTVDGADLEYGYSVIKRFQRPLYTYLIENSDESYVFLDGGKINQRKFLSICPMTHLKNVICADALPPEYIEFYETEEIKVYQ